MKTKIWITILASLIFALMPWCAQDGFCLPQVDQVVAGQAEISCPDANTMTINASPDTIINYSSFNIMQNETVNITLPSCSDSILNRSIGPDSSQILGNLNCNGVFILVNIQGVYVGPQANISAAGVILATRDINNGNYLNGRYLFQKASSEELGMMILNDGKINIQRGGFGILISGAIENRGAIVAKAGTIALASGNAVSLQINGNKFISIAIDESVANTILDFDGKPVTEQIRNTGTLDAEGGNVILKAENINDVFEKTINLQGIVHGSRLEEANGVIKILAEGEVLVEKAPGQNPPTEARRCPALVEVVETDKPITADTVSPTSKYIDFEELSSSNIKEVISIADADFVNTDNKPKEAPDKKWSAKETFDIEDKTALQAPTTTVTPVKFISMTKTVNINTGHIKTEGLINSISFSKNMGIGTTVLTTGPPACELGRIF